MVVLMKGKLAAVRELLTAAEERAAALATQLRAAQHELTRRPTMAQIQQTITKEVGEHYRDAAAPPADPTPATEPGVEKLTPEEEAQARRRRVRQRQREAKRTHS